MKLRSLNEYDKQAIFQSSPEEQATHFYMSPVLISLWS